MKYTHFTDFYITSHLEVICLLIWESFSKVFSKFPSGQIFWLLIINFQISVVCKNSTFHNLWKTPLISKKLRNFYFHKKRISYTHTRTHTHSHRPWLVDSYLNPECLFISFLTGQVLREGYYSFPLGLGFYRFSLDLWGFCLMCLAWCTDCFLS